MRCSAGQSLPLRRPNPVMRHQRPLAHLRPPSFAGLRRRRRSKSVPSFASGAASTATSPPNSPLVCAEKRDFHSGGRQKARAAGRIDKKHPSHVRPLQRVRAESPVTEPAQRSHQGTGSPISQSGKAADQKAERARALKTPSPVPAPASHSRPRPSFEQRPLQTLSRSAAVAIVQHAEGLNPCEDCGRLNAKVGAGRPAPLQRLPVIPSPQFRRQYNLPSFPSFPRKRESRNSQ